MHFWTDEMLREHQWFPMSCNRADFNGTTLQGICDFLQYPDPDKSSVHRYSHHGASFVHQFAQIRTVGIDATIASLCQICPWYNSS